MGTIQELNDRRVELEVELTEVRQELAARAGEVDDPSDRSEDIPVPGRGKSGPPPDPRPDPEVDPVTGMAVGDEKRVNKSTEKMTGSSTHARRPDGTTPKSNK